MSKLNFNEEQLSVINELDKNILLIAPAGTGKSSVLAERISNIIKSEKATASEILAISFTNKACKDLKEKVFNLANCNDSSEMVIKTFHSLCFYIIKNEYKSLDVYSNFTIFDEEDCLGLINRLTNIGQNKLNATRLQKLIDLLKRIRIEENIFSDSSKEDYLKALNILFSGSKDSLLNSALKVTWNSYDTALKKIFNEKGAILAYNYDKILAANGGLDFNDLVSKVVLLFNDEKIVEKYRSRFKYICIDEVQDTSSLEYTILTKISKGKNLILCGDKFQSIYQWRGANVEFVFSKFQAEYSPVIKILNKNYRSTKNIVNGSKHFLLNSANTKDFKDSYKKIDVASDISGSKIKISKCDNITKEASTVINRLNEFSIEELKSSCILTRTNYYNIELSKQLASLPTNGKYVFALVDDFKFFRREEIKDMLAFFKYFVNTNDSNSLLRIIKKFKTGIGGTTLDKINSPECRKVGIKINDFISSNGVNFFGKLIENYNEDNIVVFDVESTGVDTTSDEIIQIAAIKINKNGEIIDTFEKFIKPSKSVGTSSVIHGFTDDYLNEHGESKISVLESFKMFVFGSVIVGHNVNFDISILMSELNRTPEISSNINIEGVFDTLDIFRRFYPGLENHKLGFLSKMFGTKTEPNHNALADIKATAELLVMVINNNLIPTQDERVKISSEYYNKFEKFRALMAGIDNITYQKRPHEVLYEVLTQFNMLSVYTEDTVDAKRERLRHLYSLLKLLDDSNKSSREALIDAVAMGSLSNGEMEELMFNKTGIIRVPIITVHQSKGLEYNNVFLVGINEGAFPLRVGSVDEETRLFYVAMTRAKKNLEILCPQMNVWGKVTEESSFVRVLKNHCEEYIETK